MLSKNLIETIEVMATRLMQSYIIYLLLRGLYDKIPVRCNTWSDFMDDTLGLSTSILVSAIIRSAMRNLFILNKWIKRFALPL